MLSTERPRKKRGNRYQYFLTEVSKTNLIFFPQDEKCCFAHKYLRMIEIPDLSLPITQIVSNKLQMKTKTTKAQKYREAFLERSNAVQLSERQGSKSHLVAPPNISMLLSVQEKTFPAGALLLHVAKL